MKQFVPNLPVSAAHTILSFLFGTRGPPSHPDPINHTNTALSGSGIKASCLGGGGYPCGKLIVAFGLIACRFSVRIRVRVKVRAGLEFGLGLWSRLGLNLGPGLWWRVRVIKTGRVARGRVNLTFTK